jgi:putative ABC transport system permease protein
MFKNYFKTAWRNLMKNKTFSLINIAGLSIGISAALIIFLIVKHDYSFDKFEKDSDRIYRIVEKNTLKVSGENNGNSAMPDPLGNAVSKEVTGLDAVVSMTRSSIAKVSVPNKDTDKKTEFKTEEDILFTNTNYFDFVGYNWLAGSPATALQQPYQVVLTESNAKLYFPGITPAQVIGRELYFDDSVRTIVTGVVKNISENTIFKYKTFISRITLETTSLKPRFWDRWNHAGPSLVFVKLAPGTTTANINSQVNKLFAKYYKPDNQDAEIRTFDLQPLNDIHFKSYYDRSSSGLADKSVLNGLMAIAAFLLILACINFINLTTAQASQRAKEIGVRKTMGSSKRQLIAQFMSETFILTCIATVISVAVTPLLLRTFAAYIPKDVQLNIFNQPIIVLFLSILVLLVSVLAGFYPSALLSSYKPVLVLKSSVSGGVSSKTWLRKSLTVTQFVIAQVFIIATLLVSKQINYSLNKNIGIKKDAVLYFGNYTDTSSAKKNFLVNKLKTIPGLASVSLSMDPPSSTSTWTDNMKYEDNNKEIQTDVQVKIGDSNYIKLYQIKLLAGKNLVNNDSMGDLLINETYLHALGFTNPNDIIGHYIDVYGKKRVIGVVQDFNQKSLHEAITPLLVTGDIHSEYTFNIALQPQNEDGTAWQTTIGKIKQAWQEVYPGKILIILFSMMKLLITILLKKMFPPY